MNQAEPLSEESFIRRATSFLSERTDVAGGLDPDQQLVDSGVMDSLLVLEFFFFLEELKGGPIDPERASLESLSSLRNAYRLVAE